MIQRFLIAAIAGFLVLISQIIVSAASGYDWSKDFLVTSISNRTEEEILADANSYNWNLAPRIGSKVEFARYIERCRLNGEKKFYFVPINGIKIDTIEDFVSLSSAPYVSINDVYYSDGSTRKICEIVEYPGTRVANAYLRGNTSNLTYEEWQLYYKALEIVNVAQQKSSSIEKVRYIHDEICRRVYFISQLEPPRVKTAIGALIDGQACCQGYADTFSMLCRMCNFNVMMIHGYFDGGEHAWNAIDLGDGRFYCVDVQIDDPNNGNINHDYFYKPFEVMNNHYSCEWEIIPNLQ